MFSLILTAALLSGQPEAKASQILAGDALQAAATLERAVEPAYQSCRFKGSAATGSYSFYLQTHAPVASIQESLNSGNGLLADAGGERDQAISKMSEGTSLYAAGSIAMLYSQWVNAADFFAEARGRWNEAAGRWNACCAKTEEASAKYQEVLDATR